jgi:ABC-type polysaccharide/polyol phosphate export permease
MNTVITEITYAVKSFPVALHFAWGDTKARYRRSLLGPFWIVLSTALGVVGLGIVWSALLNVERETMIPSLTVGLVVWQLIAGCVTESPSVFLRNASLIRNIKTPFLIFPLQMILRQLINFAHNAVVIVVVLLIFPPNADIGTVLLAIPGLLLVLLNLLWIGLLIGMIGARYRDLEPLITSIMPILFFVSPVIFRASQVPISSTVIWANPFTYFINVIREPLQGVVPQMFEYYVMAGILVAGWSVALWLLNARHSRLAFWV